MIARSLSGTHRSLGGLKGARAMAPVSAIGVVCPASRPARGRVSSEGSKSAVTGAIGRRFSRYYHEVERLATWRGRDMKDRRRYSAQMGGADPGP
jgi:hypothetical protein